MKPPPSVKLRRCWLPLIVAVVLVGCREEGEDASATPKSSKPAAMVVETVVESAAPSPDEPVETPAMPKTEAPTVPEPKTPAPEATTPPSTPPEDQAPASPTNKSPAEAPPAATPEVETPEEPVEPEAPAAAGGGKLGPPLGEDMAKLVPLEPNPAVWIDKATHRVILTSQVCQRNAPLEMFACPSGTKEHEAVVAIPALARTIHAALLAVGAKPGKPVQFHPDYVPATGTEIAIDVRWKDEAGELHSAKAQDWIRDIKTKKPMTHNWVFGGSNFWTDEETGRQYYSADGGDLVCVSNFPSAMLDLPIESSQSDSQLLFEAFTEHIPELGTPVTVILKPKLAKEKPE